MERWDKTKRSTPNYRFLVMGPSGMWAIFDECTGLKAEIEMFEYQEGGENSFVHRLPGRRKFTNVTLKRGMTNSLELWAWYQQVVSGNVAQRRNLSIFLYDEEHKASVSWEVIGAFPIRWEGPAVKADTSTISIETLEITYQYFKMVSNNGG